MSKETKPEVFPKEMGTCADLLWKLDQERKAIIKKAEAIETRQVALRKHIIDNLPKSKATGVAGRLARVKIDVKEILQAKDWDKVYKYILKVKRPDLLQRRLSEGAINEIIEAGHDVPGVEVFRCKVVSLGKI
jgi:hypothetical protein